MSETDTIRIAETGAHFTRLTEGAFAGMWVATNDIDAPVRVMLGDMQIAALGAVVAA